MTDVSGIPNLGFGGGGYFGGIPNQQPAMGADQINASMWGNYSPQQAQSTLNNIYGPGGFGAQPAYYAGLGAAYGRSTGGFGRMPDGSKAPAGRVGTIGNPGTSNPGYLDYGGGADIDWMLKGSQGPRPSSGGGIGSDAGYGGQDMGSYPGGFVSSKSRLPPAGPGDPYFMNSNPAGFNPSRYGGIGSDARFGGQEDTAWVQGGSQGARPSSGLAFGGDEDIGWMLRGSQGTRPSQGGGIGSDAARVPAAAPNRPGFPTQSQDWDTTFNNTVNGDAGNPYPLGDSSWYPSQRTPYSGGGIGSDLRFGGQQDLHWMQGGSIGPRPSSSPQSGGSDFRYGGPADIEWMQRGSQGPRPSTSQGFNAPEDVEWMLRGSQGPRPSLMSQSPRPSSVGGIGSDAHYGGQQGNPYNAALDRLRAGQGWTIAQQPPAASQGTLTSRINQGFYDIGIAGDAYGRAIGGGFGMNLPNSGQTLTPQDLAIPYMNPNPGN